MTSVLSQFHGIFSAANDTICAPKPPFSLVPQRLRDDLCTLVGAKDIIHVESVQGGVSASAAYLVTFDNARKVFVKGSHPGDQSHGAANLRGECMAYRSIDILHDVSPPLCGMVSADRGDDQGWWLGVWGAVDATSRAYDAAALFALLDEIQQSEVPAKVGLPVASAHPYLSQFMNDVYKWQRLRNDSTRTQKFIQCFDHTVAIQQWLSTEIDTLCRLQTEASTHSWRLGLVHGDLRCDNYIFGELSQQPARWYVIDWANAADGPLAFDRVMLAASLCADGVCDPQAAFRMACDHLNSDDIRLMIVMQAGYFADQVYRAPPAVMPRLRPLQKAMLVALLEMLGVEGSIMPLSSFIAP